MSSRSPPDLHSFPTRRSSDLGPTDPTGPRPLPTSSGRTAVLARASHSRIAGKIVTERVRRMSENGREGIDGDRKSTRLNSSHMSISYAVFCLKKKKKEGESGT